MRLLTAAALVLSLLLATGLAAGEEVRATECKVVQLKTSDGLTLAADHCSSGAPDSPAVVLLHMIPPHNDRSNYPESFRRKLAAKGLQVLSIDRRGAGDSEGVAKEAYIGPKGALDVQAALDWLRANTDADPSRWACVGASNGTTSCLDHAVHASKDEALTGPTALVFMTGGTYTEAQNLVATSPATAADVLFTFNASEAEWSQAQRPAPHTGDWQLRSYAPGGHGTRVFEPNPEAMDDIADFLAASLRKGK